MLWWIVQNVTIMALLAGVVWITCRLAKAGPVTRHALWLLVLLKMLTPPMVVWPWPAPLALSGDARAGRQSAPVHVKQMSAQAPPAVETTGVDMAVPMDAPAADRDPVVGSAAPVPHDARRTSASSADPVFSPAPILPSLGQLILPALAIIWAIGAICFALLQVVRILRMLRQARLMIHEQSFDPRLAMRVQAMSRMLRVRAPRLRMVGGIGSPLIFSLIRPQLWWPAELGPQLSDDALCGLILHELAHVKRRDHWVGWLELLAGCLWWWNPLYWYVRFQLRENAELACDGWVVAKLPRGRRAYGEALLAVCECMVGRGTALPALGVGTGGRQFLERRLTMILRERIGLRLHAAGLLFVGLLAMAALPAWSQKYETQKPAEPEAQKTATNSEIPSGFPDRPRPYVSYFDPNRTTSAQPLPNDALQVLRQFTSDEQEARRQAEQKIAELRQQAMARLKELQDQYARNGQLDEAVAIRDRIRQMQGNNATGATTAAAPRTRSSHIRVEGDPGDLVGYRGKVGQHFYFDIVGSTSGTIWGSGVYTDDSALATAAVHAGLLKDGERGVVRVTLLAGQDSYEGTTANGVTSQSYAQWEGSYRVDRGGAIADRSLSSSAQTADPGTLTSMRDHVDQSFVFQVTGTAEGTIWGGGDGVYTDDSPLATAAVHSGVLKPGETGAVRVTILPGRDSYEGSTQNGVKSLPYGVFSGSYRIEPDRSHLRGRELNQPENEVRKF
jgi:beta-lactamase regulating signal transducer with metallopeptidase domain